MIAAYRNAYISMAMSLLMAVLATRALNAVTSSAAGNPEKLSHKDLNRKLEDIEYELHYGGLMIASGDSLSGTVVVIAGALDIQDGGVLAGDAWIINGALILTGASKVTGSVKLVNGEEYLSRFAVVGGGISHYICECRLDDERYEEKGEVEFIKHEDPRAVKIKPRIRPGQPNRADYNIINFGLQRRNPRHRGPYISGHALVRVPLWFDTRGYLGFDVELNIPLVEERLNLVLRGFKMSVTNDDWMVPRIENSVFLVVGGHDFADYWERRGGELGFEILFGEQMSLDLFASFQEDVSLETKRAPSIFQSDNKKRENPQIDDGNRLAVAGIFTIDTREDKSWPRNAWLLRLWIEKGIADGPGDFSYAAFDIDLNRYSSLPAGFQLDLRAKVFSSFDAIPAQVTRTLYGYSGLRGSSTGVFDMQRGDRLALFSGELRKWLPDVPVISRLFTRWNLIVLSDVGLLSQAENPTSPFEFFRTPFDEWKKTVGIGISAESFLPYIGLYFAWDIDDSRKSPRCIVRMTRSF
jgi:hypothetical protein